MKTEKINEIRDQLDLEREKWYTLYDIDSIQLKNGVGIYPNWKFMRFLFTENEILRDPTTFRGIPKSKNNDIHLSKIRLVNKRSGIL